jgi:hypothetical protein
MSHTFQIQVETKLNIDFFNQCFDASYEEVKNNMPWNYVNRKLLTDDIPYLETKKFLQEHYEKLISFDNPSRGYVFSVTNPDKTFCYAYYAAKNEGITAQLDVVLFNSVDGSKNWTRQYYADPSLPLKNMLASMGVTRWKVHVYSIDQWNNLFNIWPNEGTPPDPATNKPGMFLSPYGWQDN